MSLSEGPLKLSITPSTQFTAEVAPSTQLVATTLPVTKYLAVVEPNSFLIAQTLAQTKYAASIMATSKYSNIIGISTKLKVIITEGLFLGDDKDYAVEGYVLEGYFGVEELF